jgi:hypothetical protein
MLKKPFKRDTNLVTNISLYSEDSSSDRDFVFEKILNVESLTNINSVIDFESIEYKHASNNIQFDIFFLTYLLKDEINDIKNYVEPGFKTYSDKVLKLITSARTEALEIRDNEDLMAPQFEGIADLTRTEINERKPYVVVDPLVEIRKNYPGKPGYPHFYNTFALPFWGKKDAWVNLKYGFNNKTYMYNSFMIIEIYDTYEVEKQKKITTIPVYASDRYLFKEKTEKRSYNVLDELGRIIESVTTEGIYQKRPVFKLSEGIDGYSFFFLKKYIKSDFYARFYFWDALNGRKIEFIPSAKSNKKKKWLQDVEVFDQKNLYLKYELDYTSKKYKIFDLNGATGDFDIEVDKIDLYEFAYDDYWSKFFVENDQPTNNIQTELLPAYRNILPLKEKVIGPYYLTDTKYLTAKEGFLFEVEPIEVELGKQTVTVTTNTTPTTTFPTGPSSGGFSTGSGPSSGGFSTGSGPSSGGFNTGTGTPTTSTITIDVIKKGNYQGYFFKNATNIDVKTLALLNIRDIKCGLTNIKGSKKPIEGIKLKNINEEKNFLINSIILENITFSSNESGVDLSTTATSSYEIQNFPTGSDLYTEAYVLPKLNNRKTLSYFKTLFSDDYEVYKKNYEYPVPATIPPRNEEVFNNLYQRLFTNMSVLEKNVNTPLNVSSVSGPGNEYTQQNLLQKLVTDPLFKEQTFALTASTDSKKLLYDEQMVISLNVVFGRMGLFYSGIIKEMNIKGNLVINYSILNDSNSPVEKIIIPININLK